MKRKKSNYRIVKRNQFYCVYDLARNRLIAIFRNKRKVEGWVKRYLLKGEVSEKCMDEMILLHIRATVGWHTKGSILECVEYRTGHPWSKLAEIWDIEKVLLNHYHYRLEG